MLPYPFLRSCQMILKTTDTLNRLSEMPQNMRTLYLKGLNSRYEQTNENISVKDQLIVSLFLRLLKLVLDKKASKSACF